MKALIIGATGSTGKDLVNQLLKDRDWTSVSIFVRRSLNQPHPKLIEHIIDFSNIDSFKDLVVGNVLFSCLGTTLKTAGSKENQWKIDFDIPAAFAKSARSNQVKSFVLVSSYGASVNSKVFYSQMKGKLEDYIESLCFRQFLIFRPGPLIREGSGRTDEKISVKFIKLLNVVGLFKYISPITTVFLAQKLVKASKKRHLGMTIFELNQIIKLE